MGTAMDAVKCFNQNVQRFSGPQGATDTEKFNLYNGLAALAEAVVALQLQVQQLQQRLP